MGTPGSGGFTVDPAALQAVAAQLRHTHEDFDRVQTDFAGDRCFDPAVFGDFGLPDAYAGFASAWAAELRVTADAIAELAERTEATARDYRRTEDHITSSLTPR